MIPLRIKMRGFLSYKDEQEIAFDGSPLWMLSGLNGSGKSAIFDAMTFALFKQHRGGKTEFVELINKDSDSLLVEFDFRLDGQTYRAKRTARRSQRGGASGSTQQVFHLDDRNGRSEWKALEGTSQQREFDAWINEHIGLGYETFTSSVLLLQGKAERLLNAGPKDRHKVLAGIIDLGRFERLHRAADDRRKQDKERLATFQRQLEFLAPTRDEDLAAAQHQVAAAEAARSAAREARNHLQDLEGRCRAWHDWRDQAAKAAERLRQAQGILADAAVIEEAAARLEDLQHVLPLVQAAAEQRGKIDRADEESGRLKSLRRDYQNQRDDRAVALTQSGDKRASLQRQRDEGEKRRPGLEQRLRDLGPRLEKLKDHQRLSEERRSLQQEIAALPRDPAGALERARKEVERLTELVPVVQQLDLLAENRGQLSLAREQETNTRRTLLELQARGERARARVKELEPQELAARTAAGQADQEAAVAGTLLAHAKESLDSLINHAGAGICRSCGQPLTPGHFAEEKSKRQAEFARVQTRQKSAVARQREAQQLAKARHEELAAAGADLEKTIADWRDASAEHKQAQKNVERVQVACSEKYAVLPPDFRQRVAPSAAVDLCATVFPTSPDRAALHAELAQLPAARRARAEAEETANRWTRLTERETHCARELERLERELPSEPDSLHRDHSSTAAELAALDKFLGVLRSQVADIERDVTRLAGERDRLQAQAGQVEVELQKQELSLTDARRKLIQAIAQAPESWKPRVEKAGMKEWSDLKAEMGQLEAAGTEQRGRKLQQARRHVDDLSRELATLQAREAEYPIEARVEQSAIAARLRAAQVDEEARGDNWLRVREELATLQRRQSERDHLQQQLVQVQGECSASELLADLLGRDHLQLHLVRQAERQVVDNANAVLDRLSGGQLYLQLGDGTGGETASDEALDLVVYNRATGDRPINVAFLSGSQKFRVAVSLALGLGQYASRRHRPIESVIIDEGFGCLDHIGRQVMIQEMRNLGQYMKCILLVSHQSEFADAFDVGWQFELEDGTTRVKRIQR